MNAHQAVIEGVTTKGSAMFVVANPMGAGDQERLAAIVGMQGMREATWQAFPVEGTGPVNLSLFDAKRKRRR